MTKQCLILIFFALFILTGCAQTMFADSNTVNSGQLPVSLSTPNQPVAMPLTATIVSVTQTSEPAYTPTTMPPTLTSVPTITPSLQPTQTAVPTLPPPTTPSPTPVSVCRPAAATIPHVSIPAGPWLRPSATNEVIHHGPYDASSKFIHLSFDVEGDGQILGSLLNVLDKHGVKTTLFILGSWAEANSYWLTEAAARGHEFANHSYSHTYLRQLSPEQIQVELQQTEDIVMSLTGQTTKPWMRPPYGGYSEETVQTAYEAGWTTLIWSSSGADTSAGADEITICNALMQGAEPGAILLLHTSNPAVVTAIDRFITEMNAQGYTFVPLSVMIGG